MLKITNLKASYEKDIEILNGINLDINKNEIILLIGPNGAGKSTILKSIFNLMDIKSGKITYKNKDLSQLETHELISLGISYVPQGRQIFPNMTVLENLQMGLFAMKNQNLIKKNIENIFQKFPILKEKKESYAKNISGGQQQLLAIARALIQNPQLLLLDEPSLGLDLKTTQDIFNKLVEIKNDGVSILMVEQNVKQASCIADKIYVLKNGQIVLADDKDVLQNKNLKKIYLEDNSSTL